MLFSNNILPEQNREHVFYSNLVSTILHGIMYKTILHINIMVPVIVIYIRNYILYIEVYYIIMYNICFWKSSVVQLKHWVGVRGSVAVRFEVFEKISLNK